MPEKQKALKRLLDAAFEPPETQEEAHCAGCPYLNPAFSGREPANGSHFCPETGENESDCSRYRAKNLAKLPNLAPVFAVFLQTTLH